MVTNDIVARAQAGDDEAFRLLVEKHRRELEVHSYRILGSAQDAEEAVQETFLAAWRAMASFDSRASVRTWLFRIATNKCLDALRARRGRPARVPAPPPPRLQPNAPSEAVWLEPYPDLLLEELADQAPGPEARYAERESISLAFVAALQLLPPRQRVVLVLRDVLGFRAKEVAEMLESGEEAVNAALKHARANLERRLPPAGEPPPAPNSKTEKDLVDRLTRAYELGDVAAVMSLLTDDVVFATPLQSGRFQGRAAAEELLREAIFRDGRTYRLIPTRANGQPAFARYIPDPLTGVSHANGLFVMTLAGDKVRAVTLFDNSVLPLFGLPRTLPKQ